MSQPPTIELSSVYEGTTWEGINTLELDLQGGDPLVLTGSALQMVFRRLGERQSRLVLEIGSGIEIVDAEAGLARVPPQVLPLTAGRHYFEIILTQASGVVLPLLVGTIEITRVGVPT
jgi:hypothetical protein